MSFWNDMPPDERLDVWKDFRTSLLTLDTDTQIQKIAKYFSRAPIGARSIDFYTPESWPNPWEIVYHNSFCVNSVSLLMYYTLALIECKCKIELILVEDEDRYLLLLVDDTHVLNYELGSISTLQSIKEIQILNTFDQTNIKHFT